MEICDNSFLIDTSTGEVIGECFETGEMVQDHDLEHYSVLPPVPATATRLRTLAKENMKERGVFVKGQVDWLLDKVTTLIRYLEKMYNELP
jgi:hypothetical protein